MNKRITCLFICCVCVVGEGGYINGFPVEPHSDNWKKKQFFTQKLKLDSCLTMFSVTPRQDMVYVANMTGNKRKPLSFLKK